jgi:hypothetical protein
LAEHSTKLSNMSTGKKESTGGHRVRVVKEID